MSFKVNQVVQCIDNSNKEKILVENSYYIISEISAYGILRLVDVNGGFSHDRFRAIEKEKPLSIKDFKSYKIA